MSDHPPPPAPPKPPASGMKEYHMVTDLVAGPNIRLKDNLYQAVAIAIFVVVGAVTGALILENRLLGILLGVVAGLVLGLFASGLFLMVFRAVRDASGKHD
jgi:hypothetical protein